MRSGKRDTIFGRNIKVKIGQEVNGLFSVNLAQDSMNQDENREICLGQSFYGVHKKSFQWVNKLKLFSTNFFNHQVCLKGTEKNVRDVQGLQNEEVGTPTGRCTPHNHYNVCMLYWPTFTLYINVIFFFYLGIVVFFLTVPSLPFVEKNTEKALQAESKVTK